MSQYEQYDHHGKLVWVNKALKGQHGAYCLCYKPCKLFKPENPAQNCKIANAVYQNCVQFGIVTPMWECPAFQNPEN